MVDKFFQGETSLDEEKQLYAYFNGPVEPDLEELRPLFRGFQDMEFPRKRKEVRLWQWAAGIAAMVILALGLGLWLRPTPPAPNGTDSEMVCEAYVYGRHVTNPAEVMNHMQASLGNLCDASVPDIDQQLESIFLE